MLCITVLLFGAISLFDLPVDLLPDVNLPVLTIETRIPGYSPSEVENIITKPVEAIVSTMNDVHKVRSTSKEGLSIVKIIFNLGSNMDFTSAEVREKINLIIDTFPEDAQNPQIRKYNPSESPVIIISAHSTLSSVKLRELVENKIERRLKRIDGVANIEIKGGRKREIVIEIDHGRLKSLGIPIGQITNILKDTNLNLQVGSIEQKDSSLVARTMAEFEDLSQIENTAITGKILQV